MRARRRDAAGLHGARGLKKLARKHHIDFARCGVERDHRREAEPVTITQKLF